LAAGLQTTAYLSTMLAQMEFAVDYHYQDAPGNKVAQIDDKIPTFC